MLLPVMKMPQAAPITQRNSALLVPTDASEKGFTFDSTSVQFALCRPVPVDDMAAAGKTRAGARRRRRQA